MYRLLRKIRKIRRYRDPLVEPDEIFLDSQNLPDFDTQQFEGQMERPLARRSLVSVGILFSIIVVLFSGRLWILQVAHGETYLKQSQNNSLSREPLFASRGNIYDRNNVLLAWNDATTDETPWGARKYITSPGFSHVLGYVGYPAKDKAGNYWQTEITGKDGVEKAFEHILRGENGSNIVERDISGKVQGGSIVNQPEAGGNLTLTIDSRLQAKMSEYLSTWLRDTGFRSASAVVMDVRNGDVIVMTNIPEYDPNVMALGKDRAKIKEYLTSSNTPLLNRAISGLFTPGSIVKPYIAIEALNEKIIDPLKKICSCGHITIPNPYDPSKPGIFRDFAANNGMVDMRKALSVSSNIYFYTVVGGYQDQKGIGIYKLGDAFRRFGLTDKTGIDLAGERAGIMPSPEWKAERFPGEIWRIGDTYNTAIGQYGVQVTPIEMVRAVGGIATSGTLVTPHVVKDDTERPQTKLDIPESYFKIVQEGMRQGAIDGTGRILKDLPFKHATKSGTAQVGPAGREVNSWMTGFFPYDNPRYAYAMVFERGPSGALGTSQRAMNQFLQWVSINAPEYVTE